jgi:hypothetical protein
MSWEALRWTAKSPSELYHVLGPHGVDDLIRQAIAAVWRDMPGENRTFNSAQIAARQVLDRNLRAWGKIKQPTPEAFFADLQPSAADGFVRQAMVMTWMMMPRTGGRSVKDALRIVSEIFERNMAAWQHDNETFTTGGKKKTKARGKKGKTMEVRTTKGSSAAKGRGKDTPTSKSRPEAKSRTGKRTAPLPRSVGTVPSASRAKSSEIATLRRDFKQRLAAATEGKARSAKV